MPQNLLPKDGEVILYEKFFPQINSEYYLKILYKSVEWQQRYIKIFGKSVLQPRLIAWYADADKDYSYSGITFKAQPWIQALSDIKTAVQIKANVEFNSALLNYYRNGKDSMGWHCDNEKELGLNPIIGSISFGATRAFCLQHVKDKDLKVKIELSNGSFLLMRGETQHYWRHCLPKQLKCNEPRLNITYRNICNG